MWGGVAVKILCLGGGPAGLYFAISMKLRDPSHEVTVLERAPALTEVGAGIQLSPNAVRVLDALGVEPSAKVVSYHEHNEASRSAELVDTVARGGRVVVVTDRVDLESQLARNFMSGGAFGSAMASVK